MFKPFGFRVGGGFGLGPRSSPGSAWVSRYFWGSMGFRVGYSTPVGVEVFLVFFPPIGSAVKDIQALRAWRVK